MDFNRLFGTRDRGMGGQSNSVHLSLTISSASQCINATLHAGDANHYNVGNLNSPIFCDYIRDAIEKFIQCDEKFSCKMQLHIDRKKFDKFRDILITKLKVKLDAHIEFSRGKLYIKTFDIDHVIRAFQKLKFTPLEQETILKKEQRKPRAKRQANVDVEAYIQHYS